MGHHRGVRRGAGALVVAALFVLGLPASAWATDADLRLTKSAAPTAPAPGDTVTWTLQVHNNGPWNAPNVVVTDRLPAGITYVSGPAGCSASGQTVTCSVGRLDKGTGTTRAIVTRVGSDQAGRTLRNDASVRSDLPDHTSSNDRASASVTVTTAPPPTPPAQADLNVSKSGDRTAAQVGDTIAWTVKVRNDGPGSAKDVVLTDTVAGELEILSTSPGSPTCSRSGQTVTCALGTIASGATSTVTITTRVRSAPAAGPTQGHWIDVQKTEAFVGLQAGESRTVELTCPRAGDLMLDGQALLKAVDHGQSPAGVEVQRSSTSAPNRFTFRLYNRTAGQAQMTVYGLCVAGRTGDDGGHSHPLVVSSPPQRVHTGPLGLGRHERTLSCAAGQVAVAPGLEMFSGRARLVGNEPTDDLTGRRFTLLVEDAGAFELSIRCLDRSTGTSAGHTHPLLFTTTGRDVSVPGGATVTERVSCGDLEKGIVAGWTFPDGMGHHGNEPVPVSRDFRLHNPTSGTQSGRIGLLCLGVRPGTATSGPLTNTASVRSSTADPDGGDDRATATVPYGPGGVRRTSADDAGSTAGPVLVTAAPVVVTGGARRAAAVTLRCTGRRSCVGTVRLHRVGARAGLVGTTTYRLRPRTSRRVLVPLRARLPRLAGVRVALAYRDASGRRHSVAVRRVVR